MDHPSASAVQYAKLVSLPAAFILAGYSLSFSQNSVPKIYDVRPQVSTPIFKGIFYGGAAVVAPCAIAASTASAYLAYALPEHRREWAVAAIAALATQPWTAIVMMPGIRRLIAISEADATVQEKVEQTLEHRQLLKTWVRHNYVRTALFLTSGAAGLYAAIVA